MRIALTVDPYLPVPPKLYGGIERVVDFLVRVLIERGHDVTLFAHPASNTPARLVPYGVPPHEGAVPRARELVQVGLGLYIRSRELDIVHSFGRLAAMAPILPLRSIPKLQSYQRDYLPESGIRRALSLAGESLRFTACSAQMYTRQSVAGHWTTVSNGVDLGRYVFIPEVPPDAPLVFLGRLEPIKGAHNAVEIARASGRRLVIAGNVPVESQPYFETRVAPHIDGELVTYIGPVDDTRKNELLGSAAALLMPIEWEEPFGIVMVEAMACGTPVIGFARGSVPEVVRHGSSGFVCDDVDQAVDAVGKIFSIRRHDVRLDTERRFAADVVVSAYERLYAEMVDG